MIYEVLLDGKTLYYPGDLQCAVTNAKLEQALNDSGTFECDVLASNPLYNAIENRRSMLQILKDGREIFYGEVRESEESLDMVKQVYAVGELAFLYDSIQPQGRYQDQTPLQFFTTLINNHNAQVEEKKRFEVGVVTVKDPNDSIYRYTNYEDTLTCLRDKLCDRLGGYLRVRKADGKRYLDLVTLQDYGTTCEQPIEFGENLLDYACNASGADIVTAVIPLGTRLDKSPVEGLDAYLDIKDVNNGVDYVYLPAAVEKFGWIKEVVHWDDVTTPANLKKKAEEWLTENQYELLTLEVNALDLSMMDSDIDSFDLGDSVNALAEPYGMDAWFPVQKMTTYLQEPEKNKLTLSNTLKKSYTQQMASLTNELDEKIPQQSALLQQAKDNASQLIQTATNGYIVLNMDDKGNPKELLIMDTKDIDTAQKVWRWNINGLGYSHTGYNGEYGLALTMDGSIVADFVTAGTMYADRIKGGTLTLGGYSNDNGVMQVRDAQGNVHTMIDVSGLATNNIKVTGGTLNINDNFIVDAEGHMYAVDGTFKGTIESSSAKITGGYVHIEAAESTDNLIEFKRPGTLVQMGTDGLRSVADTRELAASYSAVSVRDTSADTIAQMLSSGKGISSYGWESYSDKRLKHGIESLDREKSAALIQSLRPCRFIYNYDAAGHYRHGLIAQEVLTAIGDEDWAICSEYPDQDGKTYYALDKTELIADLIAAVQHLNDRVDALEAQEGV